MVVVGVVAVAAVVAVVAAAVAVYVVVRHADGTRVGGAGVVGVAGRSTSRLKNLVRRGFAASITECDGDLDLSCFVPVPCP